MTHRTFDEQIANFNRVVSSWDINQEYKVALLGMIASLGYEHEKSITPEPHWIPCEERLPEVKQKVLVQYADESMATKRCNDEGHLQWFYANAVAWMPAPEPYKGVTE